MRVILREKFGSFNKVQRVFAFDPNEGTALCLMRDYGGAPYLAELKTDDLEAILDDEAGTFQDVTTVLRERAGYTIPSRD
jgi:hypothetical protein